MAYARSNGYLRRGGLSMRILVAEDSATMRKVLQMTFAGEDAEILAVASGELAVERIREFRPDVVFADASMAGFDGYEVARAIKSDPDIAQTPVIVMASQHHPFDTQRGSEAGVDDHIVKPFDSQVVIDKANALTQPGASLRPASIPAPPSASPEQAIPIEIESIRPAESVPPSLKPAPPLSAPAMAQSAPPRPSVPAATPIHAASRSWQAGPAPSNGSDVIERLVGMGLTPDQIDGVLKLSAEVVERVVWEVVPDLAETLIREELERLTGQ